MPSYFNPRTHRGVRLSRDYFDTIIIDISIHAPIVGCDSSMIKPSSSNCYFNPRTHRGVRLNRIIIHFFTKYFNPRTHRGVRREKLDDNAGLVLISIHAPIVGCDSSLLKFLSTARLFQSTHPSWGATYLSVQLGLKIKFQSTHPSWGATQRYSNT